MKHKIFEYAIVGHPSETEIKDGKNTEMLVEPTRVLTADIAGANIIASRKIPDTWLDKLDRVEIAVRPF